MNNRMQLCAKKSLIGHIHLTQKHKKENILHYISFRCRVRSISFRSVRTKCEWTRLYFVLFTKQKATTVQCHTFISHCTNMNNGPLSFSELNTNFCNLCQVQTFKAALAHTQNTQLRLSPQLLLWLSVSQRKQHHRPELLLHCRGDDRQSSLIIWE